MANVAGRLVQRVHEGAAEAGTHTVTWDGRSTQPRTSIPDPIVPISRSFVSLTWRVVLNTQGNGML